MARVTTPLTDKKIQTTKATDKDIKLFDGYGLHILIRTSGTKVWRLKYNKISDNKESILTFGNYPTISLKEARKLRDEARDLIKKGIDPKEHQKEILLQKQNEYLNTFEAVALQWFEMYKQKDLNVATIEAKWTLLKKHLFPIIGSKKISSIRNRDLVDYLNELQKNRKTVVINRICSLVNTVMFYAVNLEIIEANPLAKIRDLYEVHKTENYKAISEEKLPEFLDKLSQSKDISLPRKCVCLLQMLTLARPVEIVKMRWQDIDMNKKLWINPNTSMKKKREHLVPLTESAIIIINIMKGFRINDYIFPKLKKRKKPTQSTESTQSTQITRRTQSNEEYMHRQTSLGVIYKLGYKGKFVAHGFRSLASTVLNEKEFNRDVIEMALSHVDSSVRGVYNRAKYLEQRRVMLTWWSDSILESYSDLLKNLILEAKSYGIKIEIPKPE